jgi:hypothetical protein
MHANYLAGGKINLRTGGDGYAKKHQTVHGGYVDTN